MEEIKFQQFLDDVFASYRIVLNENGGMYVCYASRTHKNFEDAIVKNGFEISAQIIWAKQVASMGWGNYRWKHEPILYCKSKNKKANFFGNRKQYTVWDQKMSDEEILRLAKEMIEIEKEANDTTVWNCGRDGNYRHPTQKPVQLCVKAIVNSSTPGGSVADLFGGSGSTLISCEKTGRKCFTLELDPKYVDVIVQRYCEYTGNNKIVKNGKEIVWGK